MVARAASGAPAFYDRYHYVSTGEGREDMKRVSALGAILLVARALYPQAQPPAQSTTQSPSSALLSNNDALALLRRISQLVESTMLATPGVARAAAPLLENVKQALGNIE